MKKKAIRKNNIKDLPELLVQHILKSLENFRYGDLQLCAEELSQAYIDAGCRIGRAGNMQAYDILQIFKRMLRPDECLSIAMIIEHLERDYKESFNNSFETETEHAFNELMRLDSQKND